MTNLRGLLKSKTFYWNVVTIALEVLNVFGGVLPPGTVTMVNALGNIVLRVLTVQSLADKVK